MRGDAALRELRQEVARLAAQVAQLTEANAVLSARNAELSARNVELEAEVARLRERAGRNSSNSSTPPSQDPLDAPKPRPRKPSGRPPGGRGGHKGKTRELAAPDAVDETVHHFPTECDGCARPFAEEERPTFEDGEAERHQQYEIPPVIVTLTEHQLHCLGCPSCGQRTRAQRPAVLGSGLFGPRLVALVVLLSVAHRVSRRGITSLFAALCGLQGLSTATVQRALEQTSLALADVHAQIAGALQTAPVTHMDETGWRERGQRTWIWARVTGTLALFRVAPTRARSVAKEILGELTGVLVTDRYSAYNYLPLHLRQICLAHVLRDLAAIAARAGPAGEIGEQLVKLLGHVFSFWHDFRDDHHDRARLASDLDLPRFVIRSLLQRAVQEADAKTAATASNLLEDWPALWTFVTVEGVEPTNNTSERSLRPAVVYRKTSLGTQSATGSLALERAMSAIETCRRQGRDPLEYLTQAITAHHHGQPAPTILPA